MMTESAKLTNEQSLHLEFINVCSVRAPHERLRDQNIHSRCVGLSLADTIWALLPTFITNPPSLPSLALLGLQGRNIT